MFTQLQAKLNRNEWLNKLVSQRRKGKTRSSNFSSRLCRHSRPGCVRSLIMQRKPARMLNISFYKEKMAWYMILCSGSRYTRVSVLSWNISFVFAYRYFYVRSLILLFSIAVAYWYSFGAFYFEKYSLQISKWLVQNIVFKVQVSEFSFQFSIEK